MVRPIYLAEDWVEVKKNVLGLIIFAVSEFIVWLMNLGQFDPARKHPHLRARSRFLRGALNLLLLEAGTRQY